MVNQLLIYRAFIAGSLGVGYFIYRKMLSATMVNHNLLLNQTQTNDLYNRNYAQGANNAIIAGHNVNRQEVINERKKVLIIGAGIIGIAQSLKLLSEGYSVILVDKDQDIAQQASYYNGCVYVPESVKTMINPANMWTLIKNIFKNPEDTTLRFNMNAFFEKYFMIWSLNALLKTTSNSKVHSLVEHQLQMGRINMIEMEKLQKNTNILEGQLTCKELLGFYDSEISKSSMMQTLDKFNIKHSEKQKFKSGYGQLVSEKLQHCIKFDVGSNIDTRQLSERIIDYCIDNFSGRFYISTNTNVKGFALDPKGQIIGAMTSQGIILADYFVISGAHKTKYLTDKLGIRVPIMPVKGWALGIRVPNDTFFKEYTFFTPQYFSTYVNNEIRLSCGAEIGSDFSKEIPSEEWGAKMGLKYFNQHFGFNINMDDCYVRHCYRPITPDDIPIISQVPVFNNVFISAGHGSKGMTYCFGSAEILFQILSGIKEYPEYNINRFYLV
ncbi:unnamed protein product [Paramecium pentaurelia]|uniref:FAD-dependent oxidoreductase domain-containing protein 1 n=1 Tax=Paramecium pentaurelia TaxID=43138 RepID=A0A8S1Y4Y8_9CILI|nr:unnamed protein product [Paramecium pentaurelia]